MQLQHNRSQFVVLYLLVLAAVLIALPRSAPAQQKGGNFAPVPSNKGGEDKSVTISTNLVSLRVSVTDKQGRVVPGLDQSSFAVYENGVRQEVRFFSDQDAPAAIATVLDVSGSMTGEKIVQARDALERFIRTGHEEDEYSLVVFNQSPKLLLSGIRGSEGMPAIVSGIQPQGNTAFYDAVALGLDDVQRGRLNKRALIVISDGEDNSSRLDFGRIRRMVREADVTIYTILIGPLPPRGNGRAIMEELASVSGGKSYFPGNGETMSEAFEQIAVELRRQYSIGYTPSNFVADGKWRRIEIKVTSPNAFPHLVVRSRAGYYATGRSGNLRRSESEPLAGRGQE
jgi:Ca-activated chloride channel homolog